MGPAGMDDERETRQRRGDDAEIEPVAEQAIESDDGDFASEHSSPTYADESENGPEGAPEAGAPRGYAGMD